MPASINSGSRYALPAPSIARKPSIHAFPMEIFFGNHYHIGTQCAYPTFRDLAPPPHYDMIMLYYASHNLRKWTCKSDRQIPSDSISANHLRLVNFAEIIGQSNAEKCTREKRHMGVLHMLQFIGYNDAIFYDARSPTRPIVVNCSPRTLSNNAGSNQD